MDGPTDRNTTAAATKAAVATAPTPAEKAEEQRVQLHKAEREAQLRFRGEIERLEKRDLQLWSIVVLIVLALAAGLAALVAPNLMWQLGLMKVWGGLLPQFFFAFVTLVILFNIYILQQRRELHQTREELVRQVVYNEAATRLSMIDPLTDTFNRRYIEEVLSKDLKRADRLGISLGCVMIDIDDFKAVNTKFGHLVGDRVLMEVANLLKETFRASDIIIRYGGDEFVVMLNDTDQERSYLALDRLQRAIDRWNAGEERIPGYKMSLGWGVAIYSRGAEFHNVLDSADRQMLERKESSRKLTTGARR